MQRRRHGVHLVLGHVLARERHRDALVQRQRRLLRDVLEREIPPPGDHPLIGLERGVRDPHRAMNHHLEQGRLAGTVCADEADTVAFVHRKRHTRQHSSVAEAFVEVLNSDDRSHAANDTLRLR